MQRYRQTLDELQQSLSEISVSWQDEHARNVVLLINDMSGNGFDRNDLARLFERDFAAALTFTRLVLELSKDELVLRLRQLLGANGIGVKSYRHNPEAYLSVIESLGTIEQTKLLLKRNVTWQDLVVERLKAGRGSAIKGQARGRFLEDFTEKLIKEVFGNDRYDTRCRFVGASGESTEKTDFAIPDRNDPRILIEVKAYGATGSKQTDILGDIARIVAQKRHDTHLLFVTDGATWQERLSDLRKLVVLQNQGKVARIYTQRMRAELKKDLLQLKHDHSL